MMVPGIDAFYTSTSSTATASPPSVSPDNDFEDSSRNPKRTPKACDRCRNKKTKCTGDSPCQRCRLDNTVCSFTNRRPKEGPSFNPQVAQKDAAMTMLYKCIEVMNQQLLAARLGPYTDRSLAEYAESEEFIIGIILDRFGISPVLDEFDNQPVYLPGQRGFNPENCAVEFPQHSGHGDGFEDENYSQGAKFVFNHQATLPHSIYSSRSDICQDVQMSDQGKTAGDFILALPTPQRHHTYTYGQQPVAREHSPVWMHENKLVGESLLIQDIYPASLSTTDSAQHMSTDPSARKNVTPSVYEIQQAQIERIRREQPVQRNPHTQPNLTRSPPLGPGYTSAPIPLPPHIAQAAEMVPVTTQWDFPSAVSTAAGTTYPSALCSARASPEFRLSGQRSPDTRGGSQGPDSSMYGSTGNYLELSDPMVRPLRW
ncbi:hypothetical protein EV426DRAFT_448059 [Tirmania nivea]|nr:hypothetical protein EV426DRAFT_448059 [Tirmania nivea]